MDEINCFENNELIRKSIIRDMQEGVLVLGLDGRVAYMNPAAAKILGKSAEQLVGKKFASAFFEYSENDSFNQAVLDAVYDAEKKHYRLVPYYTGMEYRQLYVMTSFLQDGDARLGIIVVLSDITELAELKIRYAQQITELLDSLVKALSTAIDARSPYTANHTRNMVQMGEAFLDWLDRAGHPCRFDEKRRQAFLMSIWLHDVGKLAVPFSVMNKPTRLGPELENIEKRFEKIHLLDRIAFLEHRLTKEAYEMREAFRLKCLTNIRRINVTEFVTDEDMELVQGIACIRYQDEDGSEKTVLTEIETKNLLIRRGTLTDEERTVMQSHASTTARILETVDFPDDYAQVPKWAAMHHETLDGSGYPEHRSGSDIPFEVRILTILDIFESLTAKDRPYKEPFPLDKTLNILRSMVKEGKLDGEILSLFEQSRAWETIL